jgi:hypothetical protein
MILDNSWAGAAELKDYEKSVRRSIDEDVEKIKKDPFPGPEELYTDIAVNNSDHYVRGVEHKLTRCPELLLPVEEDSVSGAAGSGTHLRGG